MLDRTPDRRVSSRGRSGWSAGGAGFQGDDALGLGDAELGEDGALDVQFARRDYQHRCRLAAPGDVNAQQWLTVPVHLPGGRGTLIRDVRIVDPPAAKRRVVLLDHWILASFHARVRISLTVSSGVWSEVSSQRPRRGVSFRRPWSSRLMVHGL